MSYLIDLVGRYSINIEDELGEPIVGSPFELLVVGGVSSAQHSVLRGVDLGESVAALPPTTAGTRYACTVEARDCFGNARSRGGDTLAVRASGSENFAGSAVDNGDGSYEV